MVETARGGKQHTPRKKSLIRRFGGAEHYGDRGPSFALPRLSA